jgi:hypothetical protein
LWRRGKCKVLAVGAASGSIPLTITGLVHVPMTDAVFTETPYRAEATLPLWKRKARAVPADVWCVVAILILSVIVRAPYLGDPAADHDEQLYSLIGKLWQDGMIPYADLWDRKPAGLFLLFRLLHVVGGPSPWAYELFGLACTMLAGWQVWHLARGFGNRLGALTVTVLFLLNIPLFLVHLGQAETFLLPILLGQLMLVRRAYASNNLRDVMLLLAAVMLAGGVALQIKYSVLPFCMAVGAIALHRLWRMNLSGAQMVLALAGFTAIGLLPTIVAAAYFAAHGALTPFIEANFLSIFRRGPLPDDLADHFRIHMTVAAFPLCIFALLGNAEARRLLESCDPTLRILLVVFVLAGFVTVVGLGDPYIHYFGPLLPFLCLLATPFFSFSSSHRLFAGIAVILAIICAQFPEQMERTRSHRAAIAELTHAIRSNIRHDEQLFVAAGPAVLYATTDQRPPSTIVYPDHFTNPREVNAMMLDIESELARVLDTRPAAIVVTNDMNFVASQFNPQSVSLLNAALDEDYVLEMQSFNFPLEVMLYLRRDVAAREKRDEG